MDRSEVVPQIRDVLIDGGNIAVVCNTVDGARRMYCALRNTFPGEVDLLHSRFLVRDRQARVDRVLERVSKGKVRPKRSILVSTQIIEQSLDIDFDLLVSEHCPIDLLLQRTGRLQRHERPVPAAFSSPQVWVIQPELRSGLPDFGSSEWVYDKHLLLRTWLLLKNRARIELPSEIEELVESVYGEGGTLLRPDGPPELESLWDKSYESMDRIARREDDAARSVYIKAPTEDLFDFAFGSEPGPVPSTRMFRPSLSLVALYRQPGGSLSFSLDGSEPISVESVPSLKQTRGLIEQSAVMPFRKADQAGPLLLPKAWQQRAALRDMHLLSMEPDGSGRIGNMDLRLDPELGLCRAKTEYS